MTSKKDIATGIFHTLNDQQYFYQVKGLEEDEYEKFKNQIIADIEAVIPDTSNGGWTVDDIKAEFDNEKYNVPESEFEDLINELTEYVRKEFNWEYCHAQVKCLIARYMRENYEG